MSSFKGLKGVKSSPNGEHYEFIDPMLQMRGPDKRTSWEKFRDFVYEPESKEIFGRTQTQWRITGLFYLVFYSVLAVFCAICYAGLMATIDEHQPRWLLADSIIGTNPGLGFRPISDVPQELSLIWYNSANSTQVDTWKKRVDSFLEDYTVSRKYHGNPVVCEYDRPPQPGAVCAFFVEKLGPCSYSKHSNETYGFASSSPCIFIKLNRIIGWVPEYYNSSKSLPADMPDDLKKHIEDLERTKKTLQLNTVWVSCAGESPHDENHAREIEYYPEETRGFPGYYFPYKNIPGYLSPIVAIHFKRPIPSVVIKIECRAWAKNIIYRKKNQERTGSVQFELQIDISQPSKSTSTPTAT